MREARLFKNDRSQAVRLPKEYQMPGESVYVRKLGRTVILLPKEDSWEALAEACDRFSMATRGQGIQEWDDPFG